ncbi:MAG TPA: glycosyltransferase [Lacunisphaera sp.]|nr:glycosyltransferase [Lacunisphaera sp.]
MKEPLVSIIIRSFNEGWALRDTLSALQAQDYRNWELIVIDSGSTDGSVELIRAAAPAHFIQIEPGDYHAPRVMNLGMRRASSNFVIFLNADATPQGSQWLRPLVRVLLNSQVGAVYGRQVSRPDCRAAYARDYESCFGPQHTASRRDCFFSMVSSGVRKDIWAVRGFNETLRYSEDAEYTRWCRAHGYLVVYEPGSCVMHSHNYAPAEAARRSFGEGRAEAAVWGGSPRRYNFVRTVLLGWANDARRDLAFCLRTGRLLEWPHALHIRWRQRRARFAGFRDGWQAYRARRFTTAVNPPLWAGLTTAGPLS